MKKIYAIIPARSGSKGVPGKNIKLLAGYPLIAYSIAVAKLCPSIDRVIVSTDSDDIAEICKRYGAEVPFLRPAEFARDHSPDRDFVMHALHWFKENKQSMPEYLVHLRPTTPLRDPMLIDEATKLIKTQSDSTSLRSGHPASESPLKWFMRNDGGYFYSFNPNNSDLAYANLPRQAFPPVYIPDGYVDVLKTSFVVNNDNIHGNKMLGYVSPMCCEVDTPEDFEFLEYQTIKKGHVLYGFLKSNYKRED
jgi:N-acylneuraminate cytidylyltransferase